MNLKKIAIVSLSLPFFCFSQVATNEITKTSFGRYGSNCSSGRGACSFTIVQTNENLISSGTSRKINARTILLKINRSSINDSDEIRIAGKLLKAFSSHESPVFIQQEKLELDTETLKRLGIESQNNTIKPGSYPMTITRDYVAVVFTLSKSDQ